MTESTSSHVPFFSSSSDSENRFAIKNYESSIIEMCQKGKRISDIKKRQALMKTT